MTGRFAPTPSGRMHIGNMIAMLAAWLDSRSRGQRMLLRIEDLDVPRVMPDADRWIMDDLAWLGLDWDGEAVYQSHRTDRYEEALRLIEPRAYPCFCSRADIRAASAPQEGDGFQIYPGTCKRLSRDDPDETTARLARGERHSWRLAMPEPGSPADTVTFTDRVFGPQAFDLAREVGDSVIRRSDGLFSYQFAVTVDDLDMGVDSIVRGRDLLRSAALQIWIRECLVADGLESYLSQPSTIDGSCQRKPTFSASAGGSCPRSGLRVVDPINPQYAHIPLVDNAAGRRLAKRERSLDMGTLRTRGVTAEQVTGYCAWLLHLTDAPEPRTLDDLLHDFSWEPLRRNHTDRRVDPASSGCPAWLA